MSKKLLGGLLPIGSVLVLFVIGVVVAIITQSVSNDGWAALGIFLLFIFITGIVVVVLLITGIVLYVRNKSELGQGLLIGSGVLFGVAALIMLFVGLVDLLGY